MRRKVGFIGLGVMGKPMARNLLRAGFELTVHDVNASAAEELGKEGARVVGLPCEVSKASDVVMTAAARAGCWSSFPIRGSACSGRRGCR